MALAQGGGVGAWRGRGVTREGEGYEEGLRSMSGYGYSKLSMLVVRMCLGVEGLSCYARDLRRFEMFQCVLVRSG